MNSQQQRKTRVEDYLLAVERLSPDEQRATTGGIAAAVGVANGTASGVLRELADAGWIDHQPYAGAVLTERGRQRLLAVLRRRQLLGLFLAQTLNIAQGQATEESWLLEPQASAFLIERIDEHLNHPKADLAGDPIRSAPNGRTDYAD